MCLGAEEESSEGKGNANEQGEGPPECGLAWAKEAAKVIGLGPSQAGQAE